MRRYIFILIMLIASSSFYVCNDNSKSTGPSPLFDGILETDAQGNVLEGDTTDWCYGTPDDSTDNGPEGELFSRIATFFLPCSTSGEICDYSFYIVNTYGVNLTISASCAESSITLSPDSGIVPAQDSLMLTMTFHNLGYDIWGNTIYVVCDSINTLIDVGFMAGAFEFYEAYYEPPLDPVDVYNCAGPAYPNPADSVITIPYSTDADYQIVIRIHDDQDNLYTTLIDQAQPAGVHMVTWDVTEVPPGIYRCYIIFDDVFSCYGDIQIE
jgi:hypothetical protein